MLYPIEDDIPVGLECTDETLAKIDEWMESGIASFDADKKMVIKCACQNYVFTTEQAGALISKLTWEDGQKEAVELFHNRLLNPEEVDPILQLIEDEELQTEVLAILGSCTVAETRELGDFPIEDDGVRDDEEVGRFILDLKGASFESDRMELVVLDRILDEITYSDEAAQLSQKMTAVGAIYPLACEEITQLLGKYQMSDDKLKMLAAFKPLIRDAKNKALLVASFEFPDDKAAAEEILRDVFVHFKPEVPPEELIQEAIRQIGTCVSGYAWHQVAGGYRCAAGGHYVSDAEIQAKIEELG